MTEGFWEHTALRLDHNTRRAEQGRVLIGGSPIRIMRLSDEGARALDTFGAEDPVGRSRARQRLARRLVDTGLAHPVPAARPDTTVAIVIPVRDQSGDLHDLLDALDPAGAHDLVVVDDGSVQPEDVDAAVAGRARTLRHDRSIGPGGARNTGWQTTSTDIVVFLDADVIPPPSWLDELLGHFHDPSVGAVAPRVCGRRTSDSMIDRYEAHRSPLDLGPDPARVTPQGTVRYLPSAAVAYRRSVLVSTGGFDADLRVGEDVDLVWRTIDAGHTVRYEPRVVVTHRNRGSWRAVAAQRWSYGTSAAPLDRRHPGAVAPAEAGSWVVVSTVLAVAGGWPGILVGTAIAGTACAAVRHRLVGRVDRPGVEAVRLSGLGHTRTVIVLARATTRAWLPLAVTAGLWSRRGRRWTVAAVVLPALVEWWNQKPDLDPARWLGASILDDASYCAGVWAGCRAAGSWRALAPRLRPGSRPSIVDARARRRPGAGRPRSPKVRFAKNDGRRHPRLLP